MLHCSLMCWKIDAHCADRVDAEISAKKKSKKVERKKRKTEKEREIKGNIQAYVVRDNCRDMKTGKHRNRHYDKI